MKIISKTQENCNLENVRVYTAIRFHPAIFWERWFFDKRNEEKAIVQLGSLGDEGRCKSSPVGYRGKFPENFG